MNEQLEPIFKIILPALEEAGIKYWVFGGVSHAGMCGGFFRRNADVDVFVQEGDFDAAKILLDKIARDSNWRLKIDNSIANRPKIEIFIDGHELFSLIPVYKIGNQIEVRLWANVRKYPALFLERAKREIEGCKFYTPTDKYVKAMFISYLEARKNLRERQLPDARKILTKEEFNKYFPGYSI